MAFALVVAAVILSAASAALAWWHVAVVSRVTSIDARALATQLKKIPRSQRLGELARRTEAGSWERRLADELTVTADPAAQVAVWNEALSDVSRRLDVSAGWPAAAVRISVFATLLLAVCAALLQATPSLLLILGAGTSGALLSLEAGRRARGLAERQRAALDDLVQAVLPIEDNPAVIPRRRSPGRRPHRP